MCKRGGREIRVCTLKNKKEKRPSAASPFCAISVAALQLFIRPFFLPMADAIGWQLTLLRSFAILEKMRCFQLKTFNHIFR